MIIKANVDLERMVNELEPMAISFLLDMCLEKTPPVGVFDLLSQKMQDGILEEICKNEGFYPFITLLAKNIDSATESDLSELRAIVCKKSDKEADLETLQRVISAAASCNSDVERELDSAMGFVNDMIQK